MQACHQDTIALIILTYAFKWNNDATILRRVLTAVFQQTLKPNKILVIDSTYHDETLQVLQEFNITPHFIKKADFDHGTTRKLATQLVAADFYIFLTQDAIPATNDTFANIMHAFLDPKVGCAYGRQLPHANADILAQHSRLFNYPPQSSVRSYADKNKYGFKTCFNSDCFAVYRKNALFECGNFPEHNIVSEDAYVAAKMLLADWKIAYVADAQVYHSHNYKLSQNLKFSFDIGVFFSMHPWLKQSFPGLYGEGIKFLWTGLVYCTKKHSPIAAVKSLLNVIANFVGYILGSNYKLIPNALRKKISLCSFYWP